MRPYAARCSSNASLQSPEATKLTTQGGADPSGPDPLSDMRPIVGG
ncbi:MAG TPA: hypothetical protein VK822_08855 [Acetobacteraceae bacterium]|nr:hypothetical protein [Acetobacteraceae bacterium]